MAFQKELQDVIDATLVDGVITEKERAVIHRKAEALGVDADEVDVVIDAQLQLMAKNSQPAKPKIRKCPACGEILPPLSAVCPCCGHVANVDEVEDGGAELYMKKLEAALKKANSDGALKFEGQERVELESLIREGRRLYGDNEKINRLISEVEAKTKNLTKAHRKSNALLWIVAAVVLVLLGVGFVLGGKSTMTSQDVREWNEIADAIAKDDVELVKKEVNEACGAAFHGHESELKIYIKKLRKRGDNDSADEIIMLVDGKNCLVSLSDDEEVTKK